ncbi:MAG: hypothetical protein K9N47_05945 [Prosthecobacter sp.]|uniref:delta-60 repeat domain-containing protein n=1 Tax=Prosthecobacter sp. TaxID=1965333 RepID=UPI0025E51072|nr:delta-60 repeat domain-containing protein [Prosthecobacter sp.]MCF7785644.1 hypothetical protein [Prosthecobacter sp.]
MASFASSAVPGSLDATFGSGGVVTTPVGSSFDYGQSVAKQADGKIVVAGYSSNVSNNDFVVLRYNTDGTLDSSFGSGGKVVTPVGSSDDLGQSVAVQGDGKIVVAGYSYNGSNNDFAVLRYNTDGTQDSSFGAGGVLIVDFGGGGDQARSVVLQGDGKIVLAGTSTQPSGGGLNLAVMRCNANGTLDSSFGTGGKVLTLLGFFVGARSSSMTLQSDGKIVVVGSTGNQGLVARYNSDGALDNGFGSGGLMEAGMGGFGNLQAVAVQADGKIVACGSGQNAQFNYSFTLVRLNTNGTFDSSFGSEGLVVTSPGYTDASLYSMELQQDGQIIVAGSAFNKVAVARYTASGVLDSSFGSSGIVTTDAGTSDSYARGVLLQNDGRIVVAGSAYNSNTDIIVLRYLNPHLVQPSGVANAATNITATTASLNGTCNPNGLSSTAAFQYGTTTSYGSSASVALSPSDGATDQVVSASLSGLAPGATYHYRLYGSNSAGTSSTSDQVFTTLTLVQNWKLSGFGDASIADTATPDGDGIAVLTKYALVLQPGQNGAASLPKGGAHAYAEGERLAVVFMRDPSRNDITISVEAADNLIGPWTSVARSMNGGAFSGSGFVSESDAGNGIKTVEVRDVLNIGDAPRRFMHINVTR